MGSILIEMLGETIIALLFVAMILVVGLFPTKEKDIEFKDIDNQTKDHA